MLNFSPFEKLCLASAFTPRNAVQAQSLLQEYCNIWNTFYAGGTKTALEMFYKLLDSVHAFDHDPQLSSALLYTGGVESTASHLYLTQRGVKHTLLAISPDKLAEFNVAGSFVHTELPLVVLAACSGFPVIYLGIEGNLPSHGMPEVQPSSYVSIETLSYDMRGFWSTLSERSGTKITSCVDTYNRIQLTDYVYRQKKYLEVNSCATSSISSPSWCGSCFKCAVQCLCNFLLDLPATPDVPTVLQTMPIKKALGFMYHDIGRFQITGLDPYDNIPFHLALAQAVIAKLKKQGTHTF